MRTKSSKKYGRFSNDGSEYIVTTPQPPRPWINYLTNGDYCALCSHVGGGFSFYKDHRFNAVLRRGRQQHIEDLPARLIYIKDEDSGEIWTANVHPFGKADSFEARHGMGYTSIASSYKSIASKVKYFVPPALDAELWDFALTNNGKSSRRLSVYSLCQFQLGNVSLDEHEGTFMSLFNESELGPQQIVARKKWWHPHMGWAETNGIWAYRAFVTTSVKPDRVLSDQDAFFGPFRAHLNPLALQSKLLPESVTSGRELAGVFQWRIELAKGATWHAHVAVGVQSNEDSESNRKTILDLQKAETYDLAWTATRQYWKDLFAGIVVKTPDKDINAMINSWNKYQLMINFHFGRGPSYYHKGQYPAMRDSCQDAFGVIPIAPELAKKNIMRIAGFFFRDGSACGGCNRMALPEGPSEKVDLPLWFTLAVADYLRETGDYAILDESASLMDGGSSTVYQKMLGGIDRMLTDSGEHGLPLIGKGDWSDPANMIGAGGKGESVWLGQFLYYVIMEIKPLMARRGDQERLDQYLKRAAELRSAVNERCWDGEWFVRAFKDDGTPVGVKGQEEGSIWINSQTWAVISRISDPERLNKCMDSVEKHLGTKYGLMNLGPAYTKIDTTIGTITRFPPGWKENGAVFSHASSFNIVAKAMLGRGGDAVDLFKRILPMGKDSDTYLMEPYVYSQFCAGPDSKEFGRGAYHWLSGTGAWMFRSMLDYIIGVHPEHDGLRIQPAVAPSWKQFSVVRKFRGATYRIEFNNPNGVETGVKDVTLDGRKIAGNMLPLPSDTDIHFVTVTMG
jgi:cellobiose phosphorylase